MKLDANDLARWTRFAGKGGIGRCSAVQDCVAENPDDLMFLQNDEIVVLMQLPGPPGFYLGYCEGVVGRFRGSDVRFHSKLKRPILTKRASVAASVSTSASMTAVSPISPSLSPVPLSAISPISGVERWERSVSVSAVTSPSTSANSSPKLGVVLNLPVSPIPSPPFNQDSHGVNGEGRDRAKDQAEAEIRSGLAGDEDGDLRTPRPGFGFNVRSEGDGSVEDTFLNTHADGKQMRNSSGVSEHSAPITGSNPGLGLNLPSTIAEKGKDDEGCVSPAPRISSESYLGSRRRTNILPGSFTPPSPLSPVPPSVAASIIDRESSQSPFNAQESGGEDASSDTKSSRRRTRIIGDLRAAVFTPPPPSPLSGTSPSSGPSSPNRAGSADSRDISSTNRDTPPGVQARRTRSTDIDKNTRRRTGIVGDWAVALASDGTIIASPSPLRTEFAQGELSGPTSVKEKESNIAGSHQSSDERGITRNIEESETASVTPAAPIKEAINPTGEAISPTHTTSPIDGSLYDRASLRTMPSISSMSSHRHLYSSRPTEEQDNTFTSIDSGAHLNYVRRKMSAEEGDDSRDADRGSLGLGIGLTMLQEMVDADTSEESDYEHEESENQHADTVDDDDWARRRAGFTRTPEPTPGSPGSPIVQGKATVSGPKNVLHTSPSSNLSARTSMATPDNIHDVSGLTSPSFPITPRPSGTFRAPVTVSDSETQAAFPGVRLEPSKDKSTLASSQASDDANHPEDEEVEDEDEDGEWDGYGDIYDNYRYSRYSMASKKSRLSMLSMNKLTTPVDDKPNPLASMPPIPPDVISGKREEGQESGKEEKHEPNSAGKQTRHVPPPLKLSSRSQSFSSSSLLSPPIPSSSSSSQVAFAPHYAKPGSLSPLPPGTPLSGAASALRQKLEVSRAEDMDIPTAKPASPERSISSMGPGQGIVIDDDGDSEHHHPEPNSARSFASTALTEKSESAETSRQADSSKGSIDVQVVEVSANMDSEMSMGSASMSMVSEPSASSSMLSGLTKEMERMEEELNRAEANASVSTSYSTRSIEVTQPLRLHGRSSPNPSQLSQPNTPTSLDSKERAVDDIPIPAARPRPPPQNSSPFLPHPNAPAPNPAVVSGQRMSTFGMPPAHTVHQMSPQAFQQQQQQQPQQPSPVNNATASGLHALAALRQASANRFGPNGVPRMTTIYGRTVVDLSTAIEPVLVVFALEPFPPATPGAGPSSPNRTPKRSATAVASPLSSSAVLQATDDGRITTVPPVPLVRDLRSSPVDDGSRGSRVVPRANFFPKTPGARPRSRSFSGFPAPAVNVLSADKSKEDVSKPSRVASLQSLKPAISKDVPLSRLSSSSLASSSSGRASHAPSPLSLPHNNLTGNPPPRSPSIPKPSPSPLSKSSLSESPPLSRRAHSEDENRRDSHSEKARGVRQVVSTTALRPERVRSPDASPPPALPLTQQNTGPSDFPPSAQSTPPSTFQRLRRLSSSSKKHQRTVSQQSRSSTHSDTHSGKFSPPPVQRSASTTSEIRRSSSLKSKISLSALRIRNPSAKEDQSSPSTAPPTPLFEFDSRPEMVQVADIGFEMVRPPIRQVSTEPSSDDSVMRDDRPPTQNGMRSDSPALSHRSAGPRSPVPPRFMDSPEPLSRLKQKSEGEVALEAANMEAHRSREQRWIAAMAAVPPSQSRKNKKIRRLVLEGVPSSVRYLVWAHLIDSKAKRIPNVYKSLGRRDKVSVVETIEQDAKKCFPDQPHLQDARGPVVALLTAYLTMVPDIEYQPSLVAIAGHLLLHAPEEDAFWMFVSMMDAHLRSYFSSKAVQLEVDASLLAKAVEAMSPQLAKKLFLDLGIAPMEICRPWFSSVFAKNLPPDYVNRVWDVFLCEGPTFLFRIALALLNACRSPIESSRDPATVLAILARPELLSLLPRNPDELINVALSVKLKDDDIKKQRVKLEAQMKKRQTQSLATRSTASLVSKISLPRN